MARKLTLPFLLLLILAGMSKLHAQDPRFSQFYAAPLQVNPAMIGVYEGKFRVALNYRDLYSSILGNQPFRTIAASFDMRYRVVSGDYVGFGISALRDDAGIANFNRTQGQLGVSFMKKLGGNRYSTSDQFLVAGAQLGAGQIGSDWGKLWFSPQFNEEDALIDQSLDNGEGNLTGNQTDIFLDFNAGLMWYALFDENSSIYLGGSLHHINQPDISFFENGEAQLDMRWSGMAGGEVPFNDNLSLLPAVLVMGQGQSMSTTAGANFRYRNREWRELALRIGLWGHVSNQLESEMGLDAVVVTAVLEMERWNLGLSYDITTSALSEANNSRGAFEISLIYTHPEKTRYRVNCPNF
ncbi:MAG: PorP/SprF family type IX secretion system membrane protein [Bacteroidota bacterium]